MHKMQYNELYEILQFVQYVDRPQWEQTRLMSLIIAQKFCKKRLKLKDIAKFPWEDQYELNLTEDEKQEVLDFQKFMTEELNKKE